MIEPVYYSPYQLIPRAALNRRTTGAALQGILVRRGHGFGCIQPWTEFGDESIDEQISSMANGTPAPLARRALECCAEDGAARERGESLFCGLTIPPSHATLIGPLEIEPFEKEGFTHIKWKPMGGLTEAAEVLAHLRSSVAIRLDFNSTLTSSEFRDFCEGLGKNGRERVDFVEDPFMIDGMSESPPRDFGLTIAEDWGRFPDAKVRIFKPARESCPNPDGRRLVVTSYMDHPVGLMWAAWHAARLSGAETHGLLTHTLFEPDDFLERVHAEGPKLFPPAGSGLGFDDLLEKLPWKRIC